MDDRSAIERCRSGDMEAFRFLVERYQTQALGHALVLLGRRADAEDALQNAFLRAFRALGRFDPARRFYPWFYVILRNCCLAILARRRREPAPAAELPEVAREGAEPVSEALVTALAALRPNDREILVLRHFEDLTYAELAERLEIPRGTVMSRLYHARRRLADALTATLES